MFKIPIIKDNNKSDYNETEMTGNQQSVNDRKTTNVDGGWSYVVAFAGFLVAILLDGVEYSFGVLMPYLLVDLGSSVALTSFCGGLLTGVCLILGPVSAKLIHRFGCRPVAFIRGLVASVGLVLCTFSANILMFILFYGVMAGAGIGMLYLPSITMLNTYFDKKRGLVLGFVTSGSGVGLLVMSLLIEFLITDYGWRGAYLIIGAIYLHLCFCACLMRPLDPVPSTEGELLKDATENQTEKGKEECGVENSMSNSSNTRHLFSTNHNEEENIDYFFSETKYLDDDNLIPSQICSTYDNEIAKDNDDSEFSLTCNQITINSDCNTGPLLNESCQSSEILPIANLEKSNSIPQQILYHKKHTVKEIIVEKMLPPESYKTFHSLKSYDSGSLENITGVHSSQPHMARDGGDNVMPLVGRERSHTLSHYPLQAGDGQCRTGKHLQLHGYTNPNFSSVGARGKFGGSSLSRLFMNIPSECMGLSTASIYTRSRNQVNVNEFECHYMAGVGSDKDQTTDNKEPVAFKTPPSNSMMSLFRDPSFVMFCLSAFLIQLANSIPPMFAPSYARSLGLDSSQAAQIVSILGISNTIGRILAGVLSYCGINNLLIYTTGTSIAGLLCFFMPVCTTYGSLVAFAAGQGLFIGVFPPLQSVILVELLGLERLPSSFGIMCFCKSIASMAGPSMGGGLYQLFQDYSVPFLFAAGIISLANILHIILAIYRRKKHSTKTTTTRRFGSHEG